MHPVTEVFVFLDSVDYILTKVAGKRGCEFDPLNTCGCNGSEQSGEGRLPCQAFQTVFGCRTIAVYVLPDQVDLFNTFLFKFRHLSNYVSCGKAAFPSP